MRDTVRLMMDSAAKCELQVYLELNPKFVVARIILAENETN